MVKWTLRKQVQTSTGNWEIWSEAPSELSVLSGFPLSYSQKILGLYQDFQGLPKIIVSGLCRSPEMFKYTDKHQLLTLYIECDSIIHYRIVNTSLKTAWLANYHKHFVH